MKASKDIDSCQAAAGSDPCQAPRHIAIIMDGNGRWARERRLPRGEGHRRGVEAVRRTVRAAIELDIPYLTLFSFSSENWSRPKAEVLDLMGLIKRYIRCDLADLHKQDVRVRVIGTREGLDREIAGLIQEAETVTAQNTGLALTIAFNYGGRDEIVRAARTLAEATAAGTLAPDQISEQLLADHLDTGGIPDPDLLIRTSGELRISNFMIWQCAYSEYLFVDTYWPDFDKETLAAAISDYMSRDRRFGGLEARSTG